MKGRKVVLTYALFASLLGGCGADSRSTGGGGEGGEGGEGNASGHDSVSGTGGTRASGGSAGKAHPGEGGAGGAGVPHASGGVISGSAGTGGSEASEGGAAMVDAGEGGAGGTAGAGTGTGGAAGAGAGSGYLIMPDAAGRIAGSSNPIGVQGLWYATGDQYGVPGKCVTVGLHPAGDCSEIHTPSPPLLGTPFSPAGFPNTGGVMCTSGETAVVQPCMAGVTTEGCPTNDYANMWGAAIGFDVNALSADEGGARSTWDPLARGIIGFSFHLDEVPVATKLRVEVLVLLTDAEAAAVGLPQGAISDEHPDRSPYWGATATFPPSPVRVGTNRVLWNDIIHPTGGIRFDPSRMVGIGFHTPAVARGSSAKGLFDYCVSDVTFLTQ